MKLPKTALSLFATVTAGLAGAILPLFWAYQLWDWTISQVPVTNEWAGLIKIGVTLVMILVGGSTTVAIALLFGFLAAAVVGFITGLFE